MTNSWKDWIKKLEIKYTSEEIVEHIRKHSKEKNPNLDSTINLFAMLMNSFGLDFDVFDENVSPVEKRIKRFERRERNILKIHVDIDGTILDTYWDYVCKLGMEDIWDDLVDGIDGELGEDVGKDLVEWINEGAKISTIIGAIPTLNYLVEHHDVLITTSRDSEGIEAFRKQFPDFSSIVRSKKYIIENEIQCDYLIDDDPIDEHMKLSRNVLLMTTPWNQDKFIDVSKIYRIKNFNESLRIMKQPIIPCKKRERWLNDEYDGDIDPCDVCEDACAWFDALVDEVSKGR